jgi:dTDP-4-amino-4,6-dideoxygalactose transaminase
MTTTASRPAVLGGDPAFPEGLQFVRPAPPPLERVVERVRPSYDRGMMTNGPLVRQLEERAADRLGVDHVVAVSSCTVGLMLAVQAIGRRDPVLLPSFTFSASAHAIAWNGIEPRFADCEPDGFHLDVADLVRRADGCGAVMATHVFGAPCDVDALLGAADERSLPVLFDAAHAFGATAGGRRVGGFGLAEVFSLTPTKPLIAGEGGLVATGDASLAEHLRLGRDYANPGDYDTRFVGLNARLSELHAAVALESLEDFDAGLEQRRAVAAEYRSRLSEVAGVRLQSVAPDAESTFKDMTVLIEAGAFGLSRDQVATALKAEGVDTRRYFDPPVHRQQAYRYLEPVDLPVTDHLAAEVLSLPMWQDLPHEVVGRVVEALHALQLHADEVAASVP